MSTIKSINPATFETIAEVPIATAAEVNAAVARARVAQVEWAKRSVRERGRLLIAFRQGIQDNLDDLAALITRENGKPLVESISSDLAPVEDLCSYFAKAAPRILRRRSVWLGKWYSMGRFSSIQYEPLGVVGIISPWNFPFSIPAGQALMALVAGNAVVLKPSEHTPLIGLKIAELAREVGFPEDVLQVVSGDGSTGAALVSSGVNKISFTGSVATGKRIMAAAAENLVPVTLELGGKDPMIVLEDAHLEVAAAAAVWGAFANNGQVCGGVERLYVAESIAESFLRKVLQKTDELVIDEGNKLNVDVAVLNNEQQLNIVKEHIEDAVRAGAVVATGGHTLRDVGYYHEPTILTHVKQEMRVVQEETFGPVLPFMTFASDEEVIERANDSHYGLTASIWSKDYKRARKIADRLEYGTVMINENSYTYALAETPWGGPKWSGIGRTHGAMGLLELTEPKHVHVNRMAFMKSSWWFHYDKARYRYLLTLEKFFYGKLWERPVAFVKMLWRMMRLKNI